MKTVNPVCNRLRDNNKQCLSAIVNCFVQGCSTKGLLDTGAQISLLSSSLYEKLTHKPDLKDGIKLEGIVKNIKLGAKSCTGVEVSFNGEEVYTWKFYVAPISEPLIIGLDFMCHFGATLDFQKGIFKIQDTRISLKEFITEDGQEYTSCKVLLEKKVSIPPETVINTHARLDGCLQGDIAISSSGQNRGALLPNLLVKADETVPVQLVNDTDSVIVLKCGHVLGNAIECDVLVVKEELTSDEHATSELPEHLIGLYQRSQKALTKEQSHKMKQLLTEYQDIFSKGSHDLGCFTEIRHSIDTGTERPIKQAMRRTPLGFEKEEEDNLKLMLDIGVITESSSDWASAPVLVRKKMELLGIVWIIVS